MIICNKQTLIILIVVFLKANFNFAFAQNSFFCLFRSITSNYEKELKSTKKLHLEISNENMREDVKNFYRYYIANYPVKNISRARELFIGILDEYLTRINSCKKIRPFLHEYPFTYNNFKLVIGFIDPIRGRAKDGSIVQISNVGGELFYMGALSDINDFNKEISKYIHSESIAEARKLICIPND